MADQSGKMKFVRVGPADLRAAAEQLLEQHARRNPHSSYRPSLEEVCAVLAEQPGIFRQLVAG